MAQGAARIAKSLLKNEHANVNYLNDSFVMHVARLSLTVCDHYYSSLKSEESRVQGEPGYPLFANTDRMTGAGLQRLDEHLLGVERHVGQLVHALPTMKSHLSHLVGHRGLRKRTSNPLFRWQDRAADLAAGVRQRASIHGAFIVNMASTGCGKTLGNARIMNALSEPAQGMRCAFAIGLRALTLQTGRAYQRDLGLGDDELAIQVGGAANRELFEYYEQKFEQSGSASRQALVDDVTHVVYEGNDNHPVLQKLGRDPNMRKLLAAPLLVCTVDHLMPATESLRGGRQIVPMLRLMTGDLVLDEPDDFDLADLPALTRLLHWAGLLGSRVLLSSATLPPALVTGLFAAYRKGRQQFQKNRSPRPHETSEVCCVWIDEFSQSHADCLDDSAFALKHDSFVRRRSENLGKQLVRRRAELLPLPIGLANMGRKERRGELALSMRNAALDLHGKHHSVDTHSGKRISFGLIRMANINPLVDVALALFGHGAPSGMHIHLCVYHSQFPLFMRSAVEYRLDTVLNRRLEDAVFDLPDVRRLIDAYPAQDQLFVVLGSPVTEVGRDHDYDWSVVEPSSMRSLIQLAGRVRRHRQNNAVDAPNLKVCQRNLRSLDHPSRPAYCRPGFETYDMPLQSHTLDKLLDPLLDKQQQMPIDARPRIVPRDKKDWQPMSNLVDLEHACMEGQMLPPEPPPGRRNRLSKKDPGVSAAVKLNASSFWQREHASLVGFLQQVQPFREQTIQDVELVLMPDDEGENYRLYSVNKDRHAHQPYSPVEDSLNHRIPNEHVKGHGVSPWGTTDVMQAMVQQAEDKGLPLDVFATKYARVSLQPSMQGWRWHAALGFSKVE